MAACDVCQIVYACTITGKNGELITPNSSTFNELAACQYECASEYCEAMQFYRNNKRCQVWRQLWNQPATHVHY